MANYRTRRLENSVPVSDYTPWLLLVLCVLVVGLVWVYGRNQQHYQGSLIAQMEGELGDLSKSNAALMVQITKLSTPDALRKRCEDGTIRMVKINRDEVVRSEPRRANDGGEWRVASREAPQGNSRRVTR